MNRDEKTPKPKAATTLDAVSFLRVVPPVWYAALCSLALAVSVFYALYLTPPRSFPAGAVLSIKQNSSLTEVAAFLRERGIIRSPFWFRSFVILTSGERSVRAGEYFFEKPADVLSVARRLASGMFGIAPIKVVFPEGSSSAQMAAILKNDIPNFDAAAFEKLANADEGYLFPDTYFITPAASPDEALSLLKSTFQKKIAGIAPEIRAFGRPLSDVITMASLLEEEGRTTEARRTIAGILWKRLDSGMPLQVDAPFEYIIGKNSFQLTAKDLTLDSPYNTYTHKGLPPGPITNPGLDSILAAVTPIKTPYFFYLSDVRGNMHYAATFAEHEANKQKYLR